MDDAFGAPSVSRALRWVTFVVVEANAAFMYVWSRDRELPSISDVSSSYATPFAPAGFVHLIDWAIGGAVLMFYVAALWPRHRRTRTFDPFVVPIAVASTLASGWVVAFRIDEIGIALVIAAAAVLVAEVMFMRAVVSPSQYARWLRIPFALYFGWTTFGLLVGTAQWLNASGWLTTIELATKSSVALLAIAALAGAVIALVYREFVYPAVIAWGTSGIYVGQRLLDSTVANAALYVSLGLLVIAGIAAVAAAIETGRPRPAALVARGGGKERGVDDAAPAGLAKIGPGFRWPRFRRAPTPGLERRYLVDLDAVTTGMGSG